MGLQAFRYSGRARDGTVVKGQVTAWDRDHALNTLQMRSVAVIELEPVLESALMGDPRLTLNGETLALTYRQLATLVAAGISLTTSFELLSRQEGEHTQAVMAGVSHALTRGCSLSQAMTLYPGAFGPPHVHMVRAAEYAGILPEVLDTLARLTEQSARLQRKVKSTTTYPIFVLAAAVACVVGLFNFVLPQFITLVRDLGVQLPLATRIMVATAQVLCHPVSIALGVVAIVVAPRVFRKMSHRAEIQNLLDEHSLKAAVLGQVTHRVAMARAMLMLSSLSRCGINLRDALPLAGEASGNRTVAKAFDRLVPHLVGGESLSHAMRGNPQMFNKALVAYVEVGEVAGQLPPMLVMAAQVMEMDAHRTLDVLPELMEPLVILILGIVVGVILVSVFVPLYSALRFV